jgi:GntR family transcriptional regulator of arabinose operon
MRVSRQVSVPLYIQVYEALLQEIKGTRYAPGSYLPSEKELGRMFRVDRQTVRHSLELLVNEGLVEKRAGRGSLVRDLPAKPGAGRGRGSVVFLLPRVQGSYDRVVEPFNTKLFFLLEAELRKQGYGLVSAPVGSPQELQQMLEGRRFVGAVFVSTMGGEIIEQARRQHFPAVVTGAPCSEYPCVMEETETGVRAGIRHLFELGHRSIGYINGIPHYASSQERFSAYKTALAELGIPREGQALRSGDWSFDSGFQAMKHILEAEEPAPTALFACNDMMAIGAVEAIKAAGLSVPGDISVLGHDDLDQCQRMRPRLSTIGVDLQVMSRVICQNLVYAIERGEINAVKMIVPTRLIVRESTGARR